MLSIQLFDDDPNTADSRPPEEIEKIKEFINAHPLAFIQFNWVDIPQGIQISINFTDISCVIVIVTDEQEFIEWFKDKI